jgi:glycosyltransferase involved in cell wall biosynthesis
VKTVALVCDDPGSNSLGRAYCLWLLLRFGGMECVVVAPDLRPIWAPLSSSAFARNVSLYRVADIAQGPVILDSVDLLVAVKPLPESYGRARRWAFQRGLPLLLDIDDPDLEAALSEGFPARRLAKRLLKRGQYQQFEDMRDLARAEPAKTVSNPSLLERWGGVIVPHVREDPGYGIAHTRTGPVIAFAGTVASHKGFRELRQAIRMAQDVGARLVVTSARPQDAAPWETWLGRTSLEEGLAVVADSDIVVLPSRGTGYGVAQLPVKLVDAMMLGRATIATDLPVHRWALNGTGRLLDSQDPRAIAEAIRELADPELRERMGVRARDHALRVFTPQANIDSFVEALERAKKPTFPGRHD